MTYTVSSGALNSTPSIRVCTRRNIHLLTPILIVQHPLSTYSTIYSILLVQFTSLAVLFHNLCLGPLCHLSSIPNLSSMAEIWPYFHIRLNPAQTDLGYEAGFEHTFVVQPNCLSVAQFKFRQFTPLVFHKLNLRYLTTMCCIMLLIYCL